jgi:hypothetical protein
MAVADAHDAVVVTMALVAIVLLLAQLLDFGYGRDQGIFSTVGRAIREGGLPYRDAWDFKPPGVFFIYALAGTEPWGIRLLEAAALVSMVFAFARLSARYIGDARPGIIAGAFAILTHTQLEFWHTAQPESFGAVLVTWGLLAASAGTDADDRASSGRVGRWWALSGACYGCAALLKPMIGVAGVASIGLGLWMSRRRRTPTLRIATSIVVPFAAGVGLPVALCLAFFLFRGGAADLRSALFEFAPHYVALAWRQGDLFQILVGLLRGWLLDYSVLNFVGLLLLFHSLPHGRAREGVAHVGGAILALLAGVFVQGRLFPYHFGTVLPLTALLAAWGCWRIWERARVGRTKALTFGVLLVVLASLRSATTDLPDSFFERSRMRVRAWTHAAERRTIRDRLYSVADYDAASNRAAAELIERSTPAGSTIFVYGFTPELYVRADRRAASRYIYNVPQRAPWSRAFARAELVDDLQRSQPALVLVEHGDLMPWVTGTAADSAADFETFTELKAFMAPRYRRAISTGKFDVYRRAE